MAISLNLLELLKVLDSTSRVNILIIMLLFTHFLTEIGPDDDEERISVILLLQSVLWYEWEKNYKVFTNFKIPQHVELDPNSQKH